ncbi:hypothetical protein RA2_02261 [Roseovarius sp. A-2]|nr:hypothetical protein RA2_02261 [Roseovarius sp. A-2]
MQMITLMAGLILGIALGVLAFYAVLFGAAFLSDCLKDCQIPIWPISLLVCLPLILLILRDLLSRARSDATLRLSISLDWLKSRSVPLGMALSLLHLQRDFSSLIGEFVQMAV